MIVDTSGVDTIAVTNVDIKWTIYQQSFQKPNGSDEYGMTSHTPFGTKW